MHRCWPLLHAFAARRRSGVGRAMPCAMPSGAKPCAMPSGAMPCAMPCAMPACGLGLPLSRVLLRVLLCTCLLAGTQCGGLAAGATGGAGPAQTIAGRFIEVAEASPDLPFLVDARQEGDGQAVVSYGEAAMLARKAGRAIDLCRPAAGPRRSAATAAGPTQRTSELLGQAAAQHPRAPKQVA